MDKYEIKQHKDLEGFLHALRMDDPIALYDGAVCSDVVGNAMAQAVLGLVEKCGSKIVGAFSCGGGFEHYAEKSGKIVVDKNTKDLDGVVKQLVESEQRSALYDSLDKIFVPKKGTYLRDTTISYTDLLSALTGIDLDSEREVYSDETGLVALEKALREDRIKALGLLSWYSHGKPHGDDPEGSMTVHSKEVEGGFYLSKEGKVIGHALAELYVPFTSGRFVEEIKEATAKHNLYFPKSRYNTGNESKASFIIDGELDPEWGDVCEDAKKIPEWTIYTKSDKCGYSLHISKEKNEKIREEILPVIRDAIVCDKKHRDFVTEIFEEQEAKK